VQIAPAHGVEELGVSPRGARGVDAPVRDSLREVQHALAVDEHGGARLVEEDPSRVDLTQVGKQLGFDRTASPHEVVHAREKLVTGQTPE
jgi:hypothetical protein